MIARAAVLVLFLAVISTAIAEEKKAAAVKWTRVPDGFRAVKFGATKAEAETILGKLRCNDVAAVKPRKYTAPYRAPARPGASSQPVVPVPKPPKVTPAHTVCTTSDKTRAFTANGKMVGTEYIFDEGRFVGVDLRRLETMRPSQVVLYSDIRPLFEADYGTPTSDTANPMKGTTFTTVQSWDMKQNKSVSKSVPQRYDYVAKCAKWTDAKVEIELCGQDDLFTQGSIATAVWIEKNRLWMEQEPQ
jgi:hypothetical protein